VLILSKEKNLYLLILQRVKEDPKLFVFNREMQPNVDMICSLRGKQF
jgi:hypothetical protein